MSESLTPNLNADLATHSILSYAPAGVTLRKVQKDAALWFEQQYNAGKRRFILNLPVGAGKGHLAIMISSFLAAKHSRSAALVPTKILQDQFEGDYPSIPLVKGMGNYTCQNANFDKPQPENTSNISCRAYKTLAKTMCPGCPYIATLKAALLSPVSIFNIHSYYSLEQLHAPSVIIDEGHNIVKFLYDLGSLVLWQPEWGFSPDTKPTPENAAAILSAAILSLQEAMSMAIMKEMRQEAEKLQDEIDKYSTVLSTLKAHPEEYLIIMKEEEYTSLKNEKLKGSKQKQLFMKPKEVRQLAREFFEKTENVVLLSATIGKDKISELGFDPALSEYFESESPIPPECRPFYYMPVAPMNFKMREEGLPKIAEIIKKIASARSQVKGVVHCTYGTAYNLQKILGNNPRLLFHTKYNKTKVLEQFIKSKKPHILVASGMSEGLDLKYDLARFQILLEVMYPSLQDNVNLWRMYNKPASYQQEALDTIIQQYGRGCRTPDDFCETFILDSQFAKLLLKTCAPQWFLGAIKTVG